MNLGEHLSANYAFRVGQTSVSPMADFMAALQSDDALRGEAVSKRAALTDRIIARCFCSRIHRQVLDEALA